MFSSFVIFTEVVKLSSTIYYNHEVINYSDIIIKAIISKNDIQSALSVIDRVEDRSLIIKFASIDESFQVIMLLSRKYLPKKISILRKSMVVCSYFLVKK